MECLNSIFAGRQTVGSWLSGGMYRKWIFNTHSPLRAAGSTLVHAARTSSRFLAWRLTRSALASLVSTPFIDPLQGERPHTLEGLIDSRAWRLTHSALASLLSILPFIHPHRYVFNHARSSIHPYYQIHIHLQFLFHAFYLSKSSRDTFNSAELSSLPTSRDTIQGRTRKLTLLTSGMCSIFS
jgi:hypothetical protein